MTQKEHKSAFACITSPDNRALVIMGNRPTQGNRVEFPGGTKEPGDTSVTMTALRETSEEAGIDIDESDVTHEACLTMPTEDEEKVGFVVVQLGKRAFNAIDLNYRCHETQGMFVLPLDYIVHMPLRSEVKGQLAIYDTQRVIAAVSLGLVLGEIKDKHHDMARQPHISPFLRNIFHRNNIVGSPAAAQMVE